MISESSQLNLETSQALDPSENGSLVHVFGVRHLSPMGAWQLRRFLDRVQPELVLIEGLADANDLIGDICRKTSIPPLAILAYSDSVPVRTLVYPMVNYSPEYQALMWAQENGVAAEFIDLPSDIFLALQEAAVDRLVQPPNQDAEPDSEEVESESAHSTDDEAPAAMGAEASWEGRASLYSRIADRFNEPDYDTFWERNFEHASGEESYRHAAYQLGLGLREREEDSAPDLAENLVREAFMRRQIKKAIASGIDPDKIVAVVGAFHAPVLTHEHPVMSDSELKSLKQLPSKLTLMPYSYFRLSSQSGYGAGNQAPAYFQRLWECLQNDDLDSLPAFYLTEVARHLRKDGTHRSTAAVIEGVRLSKTLTSLKQGKYPTLRDLQDSAVTLIGLGERPVVAEAMARVEVGTEIGRLPKGVSQTSIQEDFDRELNRLKLTKYRTNVKTDLALDLRENRQAKTEETAFLDLNRSSFLHRLKMLACSVCRES